MKYVAVTDTDGIAGAADDLANKQLSGLLWLCQCWAVLFGARSNHEATAYHQFYILACFETSSAQQKSTAFNWAKSSYCSPAHHKTSFSKVLNASSICT